MGYFQNYTLCVTNPALHTLYCIGAVYLATPTAVRDGKTVCCTLFLNWVVLYILIKLIALRKDRSVDGSICEIYYCLDQL